MWNHGAKTQHTTFIASQGIHFEFDRISEADRIPPNIRVVQPHLLYVIGIPSQISTQKILSSENYFGKYGRVKKVMISQKGGLLKRSDRKVTHSAYFTYENEIDSSLALISMFEFKYGESFLRSCFGYSKYCLSFFFKKQCYKKDCVYLHRILRDHEILAGRDCDRDRGVDEGNFSKEFQLALKVVYRNRRQIIQKYRNQQEGREGFPTVYESMKILVDEGFLNEDEYQCEWGREKEQILKCNTEETRTSPSKQEIHSQKPASQEQFWSQSTLKEIETGEETSSNLETDSLEQKIARDILRVIRSRKTHLTSRLGLPANQSVNPRISSIFQRQLGSNISI